ncbi:MAG TPA: hypothetical protein VGO43_10410 [Pyrinomonadaceae bacterium]|jgi:hypothetical protein|nr:hypothetical protein [Pyrinomonadaceae bacterium]
MFFDAIDEPVRTQSLPLADLWRFLPIGYLFTIAIETPVLLFVMSRKVSVRQRLWLGVWLTACTYPIVVLVMPAIFYGGSRALYLFVAETFAPVAECALFWLAYRKNEMLNSGDWARCLAAVILANLASFGAGEVLNAYQWFGLF